MTGGARLLATSRPTILAGVLCLCIGYLVGSSGLFTPPALAPAPSEAFEPKFDVLHEVANNALAETPNVKCSDRPVLTVPTFRKRLDLGHIAEQLKLKRGVELGVQEGYFAKDILERWNSAEEYHLVDLWAPQANYEDAANVGMKEQQKKMNSALERTSKWKQAIRVCRNYTTICAQRYPDGYFDFIYVDARHDWKGVYADLEAWWPKLRTGGVMAGHDYVTQPEVAPHQNWTVNFDGTIDESGLVVKGAVDTFFMSANAAADCRTRQVTVSYREPHWNTWAVRK
jgi:hypothetical protein